MGEPTYLKNTIIKCGSCGHANIFNQPYPYHAGFSDQGFLYNDAGHLTLSWSCYDPAFERIVGGKNPWTLTLAEQQKVEDRTSSRSFGRAMAFLQSSAMPQL